MSHSEYSVYLANNIWTFQYPMSSVIQFFIFIEKSIVFEVFTIKTEFIILYRNSRKRKTGLPKGYGGTSTVSVII